MSAGLIAAILAAVFLVACGGGGSASVPADLAVIGNSITHHDPSPAIGWGGNWGMAVASADKDFAHIVSQATGLPLTASNFAGLERTPDDASLIDQAVAGVSAGTVVVVELGDNVPGGALPAFTVAYGKLLDRLSGAHAVVCVSTWWGSPEVDAVMSDACRKRGFRWADIGDLKHSPANTDAPGRYVNAAVDDHPHEWGMSQIAVRILGALS